jgi:hypothetical protein
MLLELKVARLSRLQAVKRNSKAQKMNYMTEKGWSGDQRDYRRWKYTQLNGHKKIFKGVDQKTWN